MFDYRPPDDLLAGRTILVTGAGDGIGRACALGFARHGAGVILLGRDQAKLERTFDAVEAARPGGASMHPLDLAAAGETDYEELAEAVERRFGALDGLLHNASLLGPRCPVAHYPVADWERVMTVNVTAAFRLTRALLPALHRSADARVLFTSSGVGRTGRAYWGAYAVSKFAAEGLMQVLADELAGTSSIRVNSINPGATRTAMRRAAYPAEDPAALPEPEALLPAYLYLMGPDGGALHGRALDARGFSPGG